MAIDPRTGMDPQDIMQLFQLKQLGQDQPGTDAATDPAVLMAGMTDQTADQAQAKTQQPSGANINKANKVTAPDQTAIDKALASQTAPDSFLNPDPNAKPPSIEEAMGLGGRSAEDVTGSSTAPRYGFDVPTQKVLPPAPQGAKPSPSSVVAQPSPAEPPQRQRPMWVANDDVSKPQQPKPPVGTPQAAKQAVQDSKTSTPVDRYKDARDFIKNLFSDYRQGRSPNLWDYLQAAAYGLGRVDKPTQMQLEQARNFEVGKMQREAQLQAYLQDVSNRYMEERMKLEKQLYPYKDMPGYAFGMVDPRPEYMK